jgi:hypothetical protein
VNVEFGVRWGSGCDKRDHFEACVKHVQGFKEVEFPRGQRFNVVAERGADRGGGLWYEHGEVVVKGPFIVRVGGYGDG